MKQFMRSSPIYNTSDRHERHECNTSDKSATRVRQERHSAIRVLHERHESDTSGKV